MMNVGNNIAILRKKFKMTQEQLAEKCSVSRQAVAKWETGESEPTIERLIMLSNIFHVTVDEIVKNEAVKRDVELDYKEIESVCDDIENVIHFMCFFDRKGVIDLDEDEMHKLMYLGLLYSGVKSKFIDLNRNIYSKYLVSNTTSEEREQYTLYFDTVGKYKFDSCLEDYVNGKCEIDVVLDKMIKEIEKRKDIIEKKCKHKMKDITISDYRKLEKAVCELEDWEEYSDKKREAVKESVLNNISEIKVDVETLSGKIIDNMIQESLKLCENVEISKVVQLKEDLRVLGLYIRSKASVEM